MDDAEIDDSYIKVGRGPSIYNHGGNVRFRSMVARHVPSYKKSPKPKKTLLVNSVHREISENGMAFVEMKDGMWERVEGEKYVRSKIAHRFRDAVEAERKQAITVEVAHQQGLQQPLESSIAPIPLFLSAKKKPRISARSSQQQHQPTSNIIIATGAQQHQTLTLTTAAPKRCVERLYNQQGNEDGNKKRRVLDLPLRSRVRKEDPLIDYAVVRKGASDQRSPRPFGDCYYPTSATALMKAEISSTDAASTTFEVTTPATRLQSEESNRQMLLQEVLGTPQRNEYILAAGSSTGETSELSGIFEEVSGLFGPPEK